MKRMGILMDIQVPRFRSDIVGCNMLVLEFILAQEKSQ